MLKLLSAAALLALLPVAAMAQTDMSCADYLKADQQMGSQMSAADKAALAADPSAAALDKKVRDYCTKNPKTSASEAMQKAMME